MTPVLLRRLLRVSTGSLAGILTVGALSMLAVQQHVLRQDAAAQDFLEGVSQFPKNHSARELEEHLMALGIGVPLPRGPEELPQDSFVAIQSDLDNYFRRQRAKEGGELEALPTAVQEFVQEHEAELEAVEAALLEQPLPAWTFDVAQLTYVDQQPNFFPLAQLQRLLLARSVLNSRVLAQEAEPEPRGDGQIGDREESGDRSLQAAWVLPQSLKERPDLLSQIFASIMVQQQTGLLRHLESVDPVWQTRLEGNDESLILKALHFDSWLEYKQLRMRTSSPAGTTFLTAFQRSFDRPYLRLSQTDWVQARLRSYQQLPKHVCQTHPEQFELASSWWNVFGKVGAPQLSKEWTKAGDRRLAAELTQKVLQAKTLAAEQGQWPEALPDLQSKVCPDVAWVYERQTDGGMTLALNQLPTWRLDVKHATLPLKYQAAPYAMNQLGPKPEAGPQTTSARRPD